MALLLPTVLGSALRAEEGSGVSAGLLERQLSAHDGEARVTAGRLGRAALDVLRAHLHADSTDERALVLECLAEVGGAEAAQAAVAALDDGEIDVRSTALRVLRKTATPVVAPRLQQLVESSPDPLVRGESARILGRVDARGALPSVLAQREREPDPGARERMTVAAARLGDAESRATVLNRLTSKEPATRYEGIADIEYLGDPKLAARLRPLLADEARVRNVGVEQWPVWHRVCDRAVEAIPVLTGLRLSFPLGGRVYAKEQIDEARRVLGTAP